jgi:hypothetical protein
MRSKKIPAVAAVLAGASLAWAAPSLSVLAPYTGETSSEARAITPDGQWIVGKSGTDRGLLWNVSSPAAPINVLGGTMQAGYLTGIAYRTEPNQNRQELVMLGNSNAGTVGPTYWFYRPADQTWGAKLRWTGEVNALPASNALASHATQSDAVFATWGRAASNQIKVEKVWGQSDTAPISTIQDQKSTTAESGTQAISQTGRAVGWRKQDLGAGLVACNYVADFSDDGSAGNLAVAYFGGLTPGSTAGQAWAISADGSIVCGYSPVGDGRTGNWPYKAALNADRSLASIVELKSLNAAATDNQGIVYAMSADGRWGVGRDYSFGQDRAVLWDLQNPTQLPTDLTAVATQLGVLGEFAAGNGLRRAYSVGVDADQNVCIVGLGVTAAGGTRGFLLVFPPGVTLGACCVASGFSRSCSMATVDNCPNPTINWHEGQSCAAVCPACSIPFADVDFDSDVDQTDLAFLQTCFTGPLASPSSITGPCKCLDRDVNDQITPDDAAAFEACATGPGVAWVAGAPCVPGDGTLP